MVGTWLAGASHCSRCTLHSSRVVIHTWGSGPLVLTALPFWPNLCTTVHPVKPPASAFTLPTQLQSCVLLVFQWLVPSGSPASVSIKCWFLASHPRALRDADSGDPVWDPENTLVTSTRKWSWCRYSHQITEALLSPPFHITPSRLRSYQLGWWWWWGCED